MGYSQGAHVEVCRACHGSVMTVCASVMATRMSGRTVVYAPLDSGLKAFPSVWLVAHLGGHSFFVLVGEWTLLLLLLLFISDVVWPNHESRKLHALLCRIAHEGGLSQEATSNQASGSFA